MKLNKYIFATLITSTTLFLGSCSDFLDRSPQGQFTEDDNPNALMTLKEYLEDYASEDTHRKGLELISKETERIPNPKIREIAIRNLKEISNGKRDFRL